MKTDGWGTILTKEVYYIPMVVVLLVAAPAMSGTVDTVKDTLNNADQKATEVLEGSAFEKAFTSFFGLTYVGDAWVDLCDSAGGEWVSEGEGRYAPGECKLDLLK